MPRHLVSREISMLTRWPLTPLLTEEIVIPTEQMEKIWLTFLVKVVSWGTFMIVFLAYGDAPNRFPWWLEMWGWSILPVGIVLAVVSIWCEK